MQMPADRIHNGLLLLMIQHAKRHDGERRCVMAVGLDILFPGKACKQTPFFSLLLSQRICSDTLLFFTELPCVGRCGAVAFGVKV